MWVEVVFWALLIPLVALLFVVYLRSKQLFRVSYMLSIFTYSMLIMYSIDAYDLGRNAILGLLFFSTILMMLVGYHFRGRQ